MKPNNRALKLLEMGLSAKTVLKLNENQINDLYFKLLSEQSNPTGVTTVSSSNPRAPEIAKELNRQGVNVSMTETEIQEKKKNKKNNPYAICTASIAKTAGTPNRSEWTKSEIKRYEACKKEIDESLTESEKSVSLFLEEQIQKIVEKHIPPKITKRELINYLNESPETAPAEPKTKPGTKTPPKPGTRPSSPGRNPFPKEHPAPKAVNSSPEIAPAEPKTKPGTKTPPKPGTRPSSPGRNPFPKEHPAPKANIPSPKVAKEKVIDLIMNLITKK